MAAQALRASRHYYARLKRLIAVLRYTAPLLFYPIILRTPPSAAGYYAALPLLR